MSRKSDFNKANVAARQVAKTVDEGKATKTHISNDTPLAFPKNTESGFITNHELSEDINKVMENLFQDYYGSIVSVNTVQAGAPIRVDLYFRPAVNTDNSGEGIVAFRNVQDAAANGSSIIDRIRQTNRIANNDHNFELTAEAADILYDFLPANIQKNIVWDKPETFMPLCVETVEPQQFGPALIYCSLEVDVYKILAFLYGKNENNEKYGSKLTYNIVPVRPANNTIDPNAMGANWILQVSVMSFDSWEAVMKKVGIDFCAGRTPINVSRRNRV